MSNYYITRAFLLILGSTLWLTGCLGTQYTQYTDDTAEVPDTYGDVAVDGESMSGWCSDFGVARLGDLVDRALRDNLDLRRSWARLKESKATARQALAARLPNANAEFGYSRTEQPSLPPQVDIDNNQFSASLAASYEVDLWGRLADQHQATRLDARATRQDAEAMAITISSNVASAYFDLVYNRARRDLLKRQLESSQRYLELTQLRLAKGRSTALDVNQQRQQVQSIQGRLAQIEASRAAAAHQLAVLVGEPPQTEVAGDRTELPGMPPSPDAGVPSDLLQNRPDVRAAMLRLKAADKRTAAAVKSLLPSISISISPFYQATELAKLFESFFWRASATATQPLFDGGRRFADIDIAEARAEQALYSFGQTLLTAMQEVRDALVRQTQQAEYIDSLEEQRRTANQALKLARERYQRGNMDYLRVLTALQTLQDVETSLLDARRQQFTHRLSLCRAVGGDWTDDLDAPAGPEQRRENSSTTSSK
jgi:NodT family efflux transporter outer membrane factor (OMF) lipoprotein